ncbi:unnamed protein product [Caenorhabditis brenneri]
MSDRLKYSLNGVYRCENVEELARQNNFPSPRVPIGSVGDIEGWYILLSTKIKDGETLVRPFIFCDEKPTVALHLFYNYVKADESYVLCDWSHRVVEPIYGLPGYSMDVAELLEYLDDNGALTIEYGIHVYAILGDDGIWKFNLKDNFFGYEKNEKNMIICTEVQTMKEHVLHVHPQLLTFESSPSLDFWNRPDDIEICLQIAHGVRFHLDPLSPCDWNGEREWRFLKTIKVAQTLKLSNVVAYCERELMKQDICKPPVWLFRVSIELNLRRLLRFFLEEISYKWVLIDVVEEVGTDQMTGEVMKMLAAKIFELGTGNY